MGWSRWQPGWEMSFGVSPTFDIGLIRSARQVIGAPSGVVIDDALAALRDATAAGGDATEGTNPQALVIAEDAQASAFGDDFTTVIAYTIDEAVGYSAVTLLGSVFADVLPDALPPGMIGLVEGRDFGPIPARYRDPALPTPNEFIEYQSAETHFSGWGDSVATLGLGVEYHEPFVPPSSYPLTIWATDPLEVGPVFGGIAPGPVLGYELGAVVDRPDVELSGLLPNITNARSVITVLSMAAWGSPDLSLVIQSRWNAVGAALPPGPGLAPDGTNWAWIFSTVAGFDWRGAPGALGTVHYTSAPWRYWAPYDTAAVRLAQRNDGLGVSGHPRLIGPGATNGATSAQHASAPRVGGGKTYT